MNDCRRAKRGAGFRRGDCRSLRNQRDDDELQPDQRSGGRADDHVKAVPCGELCHSVTIDPTRAPAKYASDCPLWRASALR